MSLLAKIRAAAQPSMVCLKDAELLIAKEPIDRLAYIECYKIVETFCSPTSNLITPIQAISFQMALAVSLSCTVYIGRIGKLFHLVDTDQQ